MTATQTIKVKSIVQVVNVQSKINLFVNRVGCERIQRPIASDHSGIGVIAVAAIDKSWSRAKTQFPQTVRRPDAE
jgi:hypothetical protein